MAASLSRYLRMSHLGLDLSNPCTLIQALLDEVALVNQRLHGSWGLLLSPRVRGIFVGVLSLRELIHLFLPYSYAITSVMLRNLFSR